MPCEVTVWFEVNLEQLCSASCLTTLL